MDDRRRDAREAEERPVLRRGVYAILDLEACAAAGLDPERTAAAFLRAGPAALQLRAKQADDRTLLRLARALAPRCRAAGVPFVVNDRVDLAVLARAAGVHVGQDDLPPADTRALLGPRPLVGLSTHSTAQVLAAAAAPVDYLGFGPVFATRTKARPDPVVGLAGLRAAAAASRQPLVAIGGIGLDDLAAVREAGAHAAALVAALLAGGDPERRLREAVERFGGS
jgi:thiamine-phosphate pyrophosphorylase